VHFLIELANYNIRVTALEVFIIRKGIFLSKCSVS
jgi:hypothetical protein